MSHTCISTAFQVDKNAEMIAKWKYCALSQEKLKRPIVACEMGRWDLSFLANVIQQTTH